MQTGSKIYDFWGHAWSIIADVNIAVFEFEKIFPNSDLGSRYPLMKAVYTHYIIVNLNKVLSSSKNEHFRLRQLEYFSTETKDMLISLEKDHVDLIKKVRNNRDKISAHLDRSFQKLLFSQVEVRRLEERFGTDFSKILSGKRSEERYSPSDMLEDLQEIKDLLKKCEDICKKMFYHRPVYYTALFVLDPQTLIKNFLPKHQNVYAHHSTIAFRPENLEGIEPGRKHKIKILGRTSDEKGDALLVENPKSKNEFPHITLSCASDVGPIYSNELLKQAVENKTIEYFRQDVFVDVVEGYETTDGEVVPADLKPFKSRF